MSTADKIEQVILKAAGIGVAFWAILAAREAAKRKATADYYAEKEKGANGIGATRRAKYKLIVEGDFSGQLTGEYENLAANLKDAETKARALHEEYKTPVACYEIDDNIQYPYGDYRIWVKDMFGDQYWKWMKVSNTGVRLYTYIKGWKL